MYKGRLIILGLTAVFALIVADQPTEDPDQPSRVYGQCAENMHYLRCGTGCPKTCSDLTRQPEICKQPCRSGCFCDEGYVFESERYKHCILPYNCKKSCQANAEYNDCGSACPLTCDNYSSPPEICTEPCVKGCTCKKGYVYESGTSKNCIPPSDCEKTCPANSEYKECGTACPLTCDNLSNPPKFCTMQCVIGCACKNGYVYESGTSKNCIPPSDCEKTCPANSEYKECGTACPLTCENLTKQPLMCTDQCVMGCVCKEGYVRENTTSKTCIPQNECKKTCQVNAEFNKCGTACPLTCDNLTKQPLMCTDQCVKGCACKKGYVYESGSSKNCIPPSDCEKTCPANSEYKECGTACPLTCDNLANPPKFCTMQCVIGCACKKGYVYENATSKNCIPPSDCKKTCQANSEYKECGRACPLTCENLSNPPQICTEQCVKGCACKEGYVYESATSKNCIPYNECKNTCQENAEFNKCGTACPLNCDNYNSPPEICTKQCLIGCACKKGYVYENATSKSCIPPSDCKKTCQANSEYKECGRACPLTCENLSNPPQICTEQCVKECACKEGYVYESATSKNCIPYNECKNTCQENAEFNKCGTACPLNCDNYNSPPEICTKQCLIGCACKKGYVYESGTSKNCIPPSDCEKTCPANSEYKECGTACPLTCDNLTKQPLICTDQCVKGCACKKGYVYESGTSKNCIPPSDCEKTCPANSEYKECGTACPLTCDNLTKQPLMCTDQCVKGCVCKEGYVRENTTSKTCIPQNECKKTCQVNAEFKECGTACPLTCDNLSNPPKFCTMQCVIGCACKKGYVYESGTSKNCIPPSDCEKTCPANSEYKECGMACPLTCDNLTKQPLMCTDQCVKGCVCKEGYVRENTTSKTCIPQNECKKTCQVNAEFKECGTACPLTCDNLSNPPKFCTMQCVIGCACKKGYVYESGTSKNCIPPSDCEKTCPANSEYKECGMACPLTCDNLTKQPLMCTDQCVKGCVCKEGYVRENTTSKRCIPQNECKKTCQVNAEFKECGTACPLTCDNLSNPPKFCTMQCVIGCACKKGYVYENATSKSCIPPSDCKKTCQANSEYKECGRACALTCENLSNPPQICTEQCVKGCACKEGYVYESATSKNCIPYNECKNTCQENAEFNKCGTACPLNCDNYNSPPEICTKQCLIGCACKKGYVYESGTSKNCIAPSDCEKTCQGNSEYRKCGTACPLTCDNLSNPPRMCTEPCVKGCACKKGYVYESGTSKNCIPPSDCEKTCPANSEYKECGTACPLTCDNLTKQPLICTDQCVKGCACKKGYVYESGTSKNCIPPSDCEKTCPANSEYKECGTACPLTCDNLTKQPLMCTDQCVKGCVCKEGYVRENTTSKTCIPQNECKKTCQVNAEFKECGTACPLTCDNLSNPPKFCTMQCVIGCACKKGYVYESGTSKNCIPPSDCEKTCPANSEYKECGMACPLTCDNLTKQPLMCTDQCVKGCVCKEGYVRENTTSKTCIPQNECKKTCQVNAEFKECGTACPLTCDNLSNPPKFCTMQCVIGCACKKGYVYESGTSKNCIPPSDCEKTCPANSEYKECGMACPLTCDNLTKQPLMCTDQCVKGCVCKEGYVRENTTSKTCIPQNECKKTCQVNAEFKECGTACPLTCDNLSNPPKFCTMQCVIGCACKKGYVYESGTSKNCIPPSDCEKTCPANSEYKECGTACPLTCHNLTKQPLMCTDQCVKGCVCKEGYVYESATSKNCIPYNECKNTCQENAEFNKCGTACPLNCDNYNSPPEICTKQCLIGCACKEGYVYESATSKNCIAPSDCKNTCQANAEYRVCGTACPKTCDNLQIHRGCIELCVPACVCNDGYVLENGNSNSCILPSQCKTQCKANAHYQECGTACPKTCADVATPIQPPCTLQCMSGCFCNDGYVLENPFSNNCVSEKVCRLCPANSHFSTCASACPLNCKSHKKPPQMCPLVCVVGCVCNEGFIFKSGNAGQCVRSGEC